MFHASKKYTNCLKLVMLLFLKAIMLDETKNFWIHLSVCEWCGYELKSSDWISMQECVWSRWCLSLNVSLGGFKWCTLLQNKLVTYYYWYWSLQWTIRFLFLSIRDYHIYWLWLILLNGIWFPFIKLYWWFVNEIFEGSKILLKYRNDVCHFIFTNKTKNDMWIYLQHPVMLV